MNITFLISLFLASALPGLATSNTPQRSGTGAGSSNDLPNVSPNSTGIVNLQVSNTSADPDWGISALWQAHLNITEITNLNYTSDAITNSVISIDTFGTWTQHSSWNTTIVILTDLAINATVDGQKDVGDCVATLGKQCVKDYEEAFTFGDRVNVPESCDNRLSDASFIKRLDSKFTDGDAIYYNSSMAHPSSNTTFYDEAVTHIWPIAVLQVGIRNASDNSKGISHVDIRCLKANSTSKDSRAIGEVPGAAVNVEVHEWVSFLAGLIFIAGLIGVVFV